MLTKCTSHGIRFLAIILYLNVVKILVTIYLAKYEDIGEYMCQIVTLQSRECN